MSKPWAEWVILSMDVYSMLTRMQNVSCKPYVPRKPWMEQSNRKLYEHGIRIRLSDTARARTHNLFYPKWAPIPRDHSDGRSKTFFKCMLNICPTSNKTTMLTCIVASSFACWTASSATNFFFCIICKKFASETQLLKLKRSIYLSKSENYLTFSFYILSDSHLSKYEPRFNSCFSNTLCHAYCMIHTSL